MNIKLQEWIIEADILSMQAAMEAGSISSEDIVQVYLDRVKKYVESSEIESLLADDIYGYGDFHTMDMPNHQLLDSIPAKEIAELLYLSHIGIPLHSCFSSHLQNYFFYRAHDDGFGTTLFLKAPEALKIIVGKIIISKISRLFKRKLPDLDLSILENLEGKFKQGGLFIDLSEVKKTKAMFELSLYIPPHEFAPYSSTSNMSVDDFFGEIASKRS